MSPKHRITLAHTHMHLSDVSQLTLVKRFYFQATKWIGIKLVFLLQVNNVRTIKYCPPVSEETSRFNHKSKPSVSKEISLSIHEGLVPGAL